MITKNHAVYNPNSYNTIVRTRGFDLRLTSSGPSIEHTSIDSRLKRWVALPVIDGEEISVKITELGFEMMERGDFDDFYEKLQEVEAIAQTIEEDWREYNQRQKEYKWENQELTTGEVAEMMGFSSEMVRRWCVEGLIKSRNTSRGRKIKRKEALRFMETHPKFSN